ncbi:putative DNA binding domain-containing protein (plasmid) [Burkholderia thailandensis]|uniref:ATP-binding protein n=1 Tax=Burkholderia thailandensis TaxID=57975 RepID=UPI00192D3181|nr:ATP-binding protein [Burkholderia thailandensis]MBS2132358.1 putative DNA binding domain-containing protein [Burkholderia thailandensis]QRA15163.1 putative DNA binding domain-containing protein [Burkholderia thailandensis]
MFDNVADLLEKIRLGEDSFLELKEVRFAGDRVTAPHRDSLADELAAFANGRGGVCILGVDDARDVVGIPLERLDLVEDFVRQLCMDTINPPIVPVIERLTLPSSTGEQLPVLKIDVSGSLFVHRSPGGYLHRVGSAKREMAPDFLARLFQQRSQARIIRFDEQPVPGAVLDDLTAELWQRFASARVQDSREVLLDKLAMARQDADGTIRPTVAGVLMASTDPRRWLPNAFIQAVAYRGTEVLPRGDAAYQLDAQDITGPLDAQVLAACHFVKKNMRVFASKQEGRHDRPQYDMTAVFEALVNAVAHRDYSIHGAKIRLRLFADRLELYSPGAIPNTMTVESLPYRQAARNEAITSLLAKCTVPDSERDLSGRTAMMDKRGEGVQIILDSSERLSGKHPVFNLVDESELLLVIPAAAPVDDEP